MRADFSLGHLVVHLRRLSYKGLTYININRVPVLE